MNHCKYYDCGFCYAPKDIETNAVQGACIEPEYCGYTITRQTGRTKSTTNKILRLALAMEKTQMPFNNEIEKTKKEIEVLTKKLSFLEELEKTKSPVEEAYKDWWGEYPETGTTASNTDDARWLGFTAGYHLAYEEKVSEWKPTPQTPEQVADGLKEAFREAQKTEKWKEIQKLIDEEDNDKNFKNSLDLIKEWGEKNKPKTLYQICMEWWNEVFVNQMDDDICVDVLVSKIDKEFIPPHSNTNDYQWNKCLELMRDKLR